MGWLALAVGLALTLALQTLTLTAYPEVGRWLVPATVLGTTVGLIGLLLLSLWRERPLWLNHLSLNLALLPLMLAPATWAMLTATNQDPNVMLPRSGLAGNGLFQPGAGVQATLSPQQQIILDYVAPRTTDAAYLLVTLNAQQASPYILETGRPVLTFGGFSGGDNVVSVEQLAQMVADDELAYVVDDGSLQQRKADIYRWMVENCSPVDLPELAATPGQPQPGFPPGGTTTLYYCSRFP